MTLAYKNHQGSDWSYTKKKHLQTHKSRATHRHTHKHREPHTQRDTHTTRHTDEDGCSQSLNHNKRLQGFQLS